ncbi:hypothetical protein [Bacteroides sp.]|uniref:hypothetical protein n=1 Tax=Bacteroides sp. TaxID=29523 RepID=UPI003A9442FF
MIELLPGIAELDKDSLCYSIYSQLYHNFFYAQDAGTVTEGDRTSILLRNTAYNFASAIASGVTGEGGTGGGSAFSGYLKKSGGDMSGLLRAGYGFEAGIANERIIHIYKVEHEQGVVVSGNLKVGGNNFYLAGKQVLRYDSGNHTATLESTHVDFGSSLLHASGELLVGADKETGIYMTPALLQVGGNNVYHAGNANRTDISWNMLDALVSGKLQVTGAVDIKGILTAGQGVNLGAAGKTVLSIHSDTANLSGYLSFSQGYGIKINSLPVLIRLDDKDIQLAAAGGDLLLGSESTAKIRLQSALWDIDGDTALISKYGTACFPGSITVRHNYGDDLLTSYHRDKQDEGIVIHKRLRMGNSLGAYLYGKGDAVHLASRGYRTDSENGQTISCPYETSVSFVPSTSLYKRQDRHSDTFSLATDADFFGFNKPLEASGHIGIDGSLTRLTDQTLFFSAESYLLSVANGIRHYGDAYFMGGISSEYFSSGFAGSGWAILKNKATGSIQATFDEVVVRRKMRVYELEVQKNTATNGSLWVTDSCSGDTVTPL